MNTKKKTTAQPAKKRVAKGKKASLAVKDRILTYEGWKRKQIALKK